MRILLLFFRILAKITSHTLNPSGLLASENKTWRLYALVTLLFLVAILRRHRHHRHHYGGLLYCQMGFFDLNIPYHESDRHATDKSSLKGRRLKLALKAMELGYTGVAYNRTLKGVMSESDRCSTPLFPISKLSPSSSSFFASVKLHRELLNVAVSSPFRQYTRLTVIVDIPSQASTLNAGNPILRSYDIVAVRPMNQNAFDQACQTSEVCIFW